MTQPGTGSDQAVEDPAGYARKQVDAIESVSDSLGEGCEAAMSDDAYRPDMIPSSHARLVADTGVPAPERAKGATLGSPPRHQEDRVRARRFIPPAPILSVMRRSACR
jgi:hypothetical protein